MSVERVRSIIELTRSLVRIPSQGGVDSCTPVVEHLTDRMRHLGLRPEVLTGPDEAPVAVVCTIDSQNPGPHVVLDACLDTAVAGDEAAWSRPPFSGDIDASGWLHGRGAADSKAAVAIYSHLLADLAGRLPAGRLTLLCDLDEHTGGFAGVRTFLDRTGQVDGVVIGYPGTDEIMVGGRGFYRARVVVAGHAAHTGSSRPATANAVERAGQLIELLKEWVPVDIDPRLGLPPKATVTAIRGGDPSSYSVVPDRCEVHFDIRLTTSFTAAHAHAALREAAADVDQALPAKVRTSVEQVGESWPAFRLPDEHLLPAAVQAGARQAGLDPELAVAGPSNIGCLLAAHGIPATAGFGVAYRNLHATDEAIDLASIPAVYEAHEVAVLALVQHSTVSS